jgi:hypothetical protein
MRLHSGEQFTECLPQVHEQFIHEVSGNTPIVNPVFTTRSPTVNHGRNGRVRSTFAHDSNYSTPKAPAPKGAKHSVGLPQVTFPSSTDPDGLTPIAYPSRRNEFETHSEYLRRLIDLGLDVRAEVGLPGNRLDLVVFDRRRAVAIIEVKRTRKPRPTNALKRYADLTGVPVFLVGSADIAANCVAIYNYVRSVKDQPE